LAKGVVVWRIARRPYALDRLGTGARQDGGRWNSPGTAAIYAGRSVATAALETFVHLADVVPPDLVLVRIRLPHNCSTEEPALTALPADWDAVPIAPASMHFGTRWIQEGRSLVLYVPSALVREEINAVLNPNHREFRDVRMEIERDFDYDARMFLPHRKLR
jgi:RES domain-containing protein